MADKIPFEEREKAFKKIWDGVAESVNNTFEKLPVTIVQKAYNLCPESFADVFTDRKLMYEIPLTAEEQKRMEQIFEERAAYEYSEAEKCAKLYEESEGKVKFISDIATDDTIPYLERARRIGKCTEGIFPYRLWHAHRKEVKKIIESLDLDIIDKILEIENELLLLPEWDTQTEAEGEEWVRLYDYNKLNKVILFAIKGDYNTFNACMSDFFNAEKKYIAFLIERCNYSWTTFAYGWEFDRSKMVWLARNFKNISKSRYIFKYLIEYMEFIKKYAEKDDNYEERDFFPLYNLIAENAFCSSIEKMISKMISYDELEDDLTDYDYFKEEYTNKMDKDAGIFYQYSDDEMR